MTKTAKLTILPGKTEITLPIGTPLIDVLYEHGVEFPCGGRGICKGCRIKVDEGEWEISDADRISLSDDELQAGYRLACMGRIQNDLALTIEQWQTPVLSDEEPFVFVPQEGYGIAVDIGTTTLVAQLVDRQTGQVLATNSALNPQTRYGSDLISRIYYAVHENKLHQLTSIIRDAVKLLIQHLLQFLPDNSRVYSMIIVGNTAMHHFFCGIDPNPLSVYPFESKNIEMYRFTPNELDWNFSQIDEIIFMPCIGGFIGSDLLAGMLVTNMHQSEQWKVLFDLGTNGEILVGNKNQIYAVSTAAGPAFEGGNISIGMRADRGAIYKVTPQKNGLNCSVLGDTSARGICGSGLVDAVAVGLKQGLIASNGRINLNSKTLPLCNGLNLTQKDIRQLQLAKAAMAAGLEIVLEKLQITNDDVHSINLAGAFGNYITRESAYTIGLLNFTPEQILPVGNTALRGAKMALNSDHSWLDEALQKTTHFSLSSHPDFQDRYVSHMNFLIR